MLPVVLGLVGGMEQACSLLFLYSPSAKHVRHDSFRCTHDSLSFRGGLAESGVPQEAHVLMTCLGL